MDKKEYDVLKGLLSGTQKNTLTTDILMSCVQEKTLTELGKATRVFVLHDFCDIRKPNSVSSEYLGKVRSLEKTIVNGYQTFNSVVINPEKQGVLLLNNIVFSNAMPNFVTQEVVGAIKKNAAKLAILETEKEKKGENNEVKLLPEKSEKSILIYGKDNKQVSISTQELVEKDEYINQIKIAKQQITASSYSLKKDNSACKISHILDREFDNESIFTLINGLGDDFVIRLKNGRLSNVPKEKKTKKGKVSKQISYHKLTDITFKNKDTYQIDKIELHNKVYENVSVCIEYTPLKLSERTYSVVRITLSYSGKPLFAEPMLLITNRSISSTEEARNVYSAYLLRFKIEIVFRFLKQNLGWETVQVRDFNSISNLLAVAFFMVGYFKELEEELKTHPLALFLCKLALSKGKITTHFLLLGLQKVINYQEVLDWMEENGISNEQLAEVMKNIKNQPN